MLLTCTSLSCLSTPTGRTAADDHVLGRWTMRLQASSTPIIGSLGGVLLDPKPRWPYDYDMHARGACFATAARSRKRCSVVSHTTTTCIHEEPRASCLSIIRLTAPPHKHSKRTSSPILKSPRTNAKISPVQAVGQTMFVPHSVWTRQARPKGRCGTRISSRHARRQNTRRQTRPIHVFWVKNKPVP